MDKQAKGNCILPPPILGKINKLCLFVALLLVAASCDDKYDDTALWDKVNDHEERIAALEKWQEQTNQSIAGIQELLNTTDMITAVTTLTEGGDTLGYTISFRHGDPITIYNGAKGEPGADGQTPQIGLTQADDGNWYWTLNGELMTDPAGNSIRANGEDGKDGQDGQDGADGEDGADGSTGPAGRPGANGKPAPTPRISLGSSITSGTIVTDNGLKDDDAWYLSVDGGATWYRVSGKDGTNGTDGDAWFAAEPKKEGNYYLFTLADNQNTFRVAAYQPIRILTEEEENEDDSNFDNAMVSLSGVTTFYLHVEDNIDYKEIVAQVTPVDDDAVLTRAGGWSATIAKNGTDITVTVTPDQAGFALLDVSLIRTDGSKLTASRLLERDDPGYTTTTDDQGQTIYNTDNEKGLKNLAKLVNNGQTDIDITLTSDIDLTDIGWTPIGTEEHPYTGTFNGGNKTISNLTIDQPEGDCLGLFGVVGTGGKVQKIILENASISGRSNVGGIAGQNEGGTLSNCQVRNGAVSGTDENVGGIVGQLGGAAAEGCWSSASVKGGTAVGGVAGQNDGSLTACYSLGSVTGTGANVGGVAGQNEGTLTACYSWGDVTGTGANVGGVAGQNGGTLTACYHAKGTVNGLDGATGGVTGVNKSGTLTACYWANNQEQGIGVNEGGSTTGGTEQVTDDNWINAIVGMNDALSESSWQYRLNNGLPELRVIQ